MKLIFDGDSLVKTVTGAKKVRPDCVYRWSVYTVPFTHRGKHYLYNNFTKLCYLVEEGEFNEAPGARFASGEISGDKGLEALVEGQFLVAEDSDETAAYEGFASVARALQMKPRGYSVFTILPTTACNARCFYCFEEGMRFVTMNGETVAQTLEFIKSSRNPDAPVKLNWFGGEPLVGEKAIDKICEGLREAEIPFASSMVTNGSLITEKTVEKMLNDWNLKSVQITLDGGEDEYNRRKNYITKFDSAYYHVLSRIGMLNENGIRVNIRVNVDENNIGGIEDMAKEVIGFITRPELVRIHLYPLFDIHGFRDDLEIWKRCFEVEERLQELGYRIILAYSVQKTKIAYCMADSPNSSVVIDPDGRLYPCEDISSIGCLGDVINGVTNTSLKKSLLTPEKAAERCRGCFSLPNCTTFTKCQNRSPNCRFYSRKRLERALAHMLDDPEAETKTGDGEEEVSQENC